MTFTAVSVPTPRKLPVWRTVVECYAIVGRNLGQLLRISWLWVLILVPVYAATNWLILRYANKTTPLIELLPTFVELPFFASIAVAWHRLVLRQERVAASAYFRLDQTVWIYTLWSAALLATWVAPLSSWIVLVGTDAAARPSNTEILWLLPVLVVCLTAAIALSRLSLVLPAVAVGENLSLAQAWRRTRGNTLRLTMAAVLCFLPAVLPHELALLGSSWESTRSYWYIVLTSVSYAVLSILGVTLLSLAYSFFTPPRDERASA